MVFSVEDWNRMDEAAKAFDSEVMPRMAWYFSIAQRVKNVFDKLERV